MLDLYEPKPDPPEESGRPKLRLVPRGPRVAFRWPEDPEMPWSVRALSFGLGLLITVGAVALILTVAALLRVYYVKVDALDAERAAARAKARTEAIPLELTKEPPPPTAGKGGGKP